MAVSRDSTVLPRRTLLKGAAFALVSTPALMPLQASAAAFGGDPGFAAQKEKAIAAWAALNARYEENGLKIDAIQRPEPPTQLMEPLHLPGKNAPTEPGKGGWSKSELVEIIETGRYFHVTSHDTRNGGRTTHMGWLDVSAKTRRRAAELLAILDAYKAADHAAWEEISAIEDTTGDLLDAALDASFELMRYPASTPGEIMEKRALATEHEIFRSYDSENDEEEGLRDLLLLEAIAVAEKAYAHG